MYRLIKVNICGRVYDCKAENFGGELWLLHNCGGVDIVANDSNYLGSKRGNYYATKISRKEYDITNIEALRNALNDFSGSTYLVDAGKIIDKPQRIRKSNGGGDEAPSNEAPKGNTPKDSDEAPKSESGFNIDLSDTIGAELSTLGKIGEMLAPSIVAAANTEANIQAKKVLNAAIDTAVKQFEERGGGACKVVEYHTARGVYKPEKKRGVTRQNRNRNKVRRSRYRRVFIRTGWDW